MISLTNNTLHEPPECNWCGGCATHKNKDDKWVCNICERPEENSWQDKDNT